MAVIAQWLTKKWEVNPQKIMALDGFSTSYTLITDELEDAEGKPATKYKRLDLQPITFDTFISSAVGIDVRAEIESWGTLVGKSGAFILGGKRFGPALLMLQDVKVADTVIDDFGRMRQARLSLSFNEDAPEEAQAKAQVYQPSGSSVAGIGASAADKNAMRPMII